MPRSPWPRVALDSVCADHITIFPQSREYPFGIIPEPLAASCNDIEDTKCFAPIPLVDPQEQSSQYLSLAVYHPEIDATFRYPVRQLPLGDRIPGGLGQTAPDLLLKMRPHQRQLARFNAAN